MRGLNLVKIATKNKKWRPRFFDLYQKNTLVGASVKPVIVKYLTVIEVINLIEECEKKTFFLECVYITAYKDGVYLVATLFSSFSYQDARGLHAACVYLPVPVSPSHRQRLHSLASPSEVAWAIRRFFRRALVIWLFTGASVLVFIMMIKTDKFIEC